MQKETTDLDWSKSFMYSLHQTYFLVQKRLEQKLSHTKGITFSQFLILMGLHCKAHSSQSVIADFLYLTEATVSRHISVLEKEKYLTRKEVLGNRRKHILMMTPRGSKEFARAHALIERELKDIFEDIPAKDRLLIAKNFNRVILRLHQKIVIKS